jgi:radical SAM protein with 4Fe4S-binding SPASM domain
VPVVTTSGIGMTRERALSLTPFAQVNVSYDGPGEAYAAVRGFDGARVAERAMSLLREAGVPFGVNVVLTRASLPHLPRTVARAAELGAREAQLLRYKPAGRARDASYLAARLLPEQVEALPTMLEALVHEGTLALRVDCALVPLLSSRPIDAAWLARFGVLGCEAGRHLAALRVDGAVAPCSFAEPSSLGAREAFGDRRAWSEEPTLEAFRALHDREPCRSCDLRDVCRGGCRIVADHLEGAIGPDPECPRVRAARRNVEPAP